MTARDKEPQPIDVQLEILDPAPGYRRRPTLTNARGIRRELAAVYGEFRRGSIDAKTATTAGFLLRTLLEATRVDELEERLTALEEKR
ncbi:hypothetical protein LCC91_05355 [Tepidimonas taiwanensis]|uniref:Uncharacterized protein n=1 Tax=Tepidimonas taiwanensis TaxID=307486 RepID=A0A554X0G4_9BURK|nr:hypothetical protein [Tepidimonas taiwanensis]TSE29339.1 hypothetical protein Ttaiw_02327 [Tepidimonas taiwanensis]UBQ06505.1 hypothetical protein LCC91_05355 [Tepidimonas taiwanensis]